MNVPEVERAIEYIRGQQLDHFEALVAYSTGAGQESQNSGLAILLVDAFTIWGYGTMEPAHKATAEVQPQPGWQEDTAHGFMRCDSTSAGRLVLLADVVRWLEADKSLSRLKAVEALCDGLHAGALGALYQVRPGEYADRQPPNHAYGYSTFSQLEAAQRQAAVRQRNPSTPRQQTPVAPGLPALLRRIRESWGDASSACKGAVDVLDATAGELAALAMTVDMACALWGWCGVAQVEQMHAVGAECVDPKTYDELVKFRKSNSRSEWTTSQKRILAVESTRRKAVPGAKGVASAMAGELGFSVSRLDDLIRKFSEAGKRETRRAKSA